MSRLDETRTASTRDDWETPPHVLERVRAVFGGDIGLDPFTDVLRNPTDARVCFGAGGLEREWRGYGPVFANPPYGGQLRGFARKVASEAVDGTEIITLTPARPDSRWYDTLASAAWCWAEIRGRLAFRLLGEPVRDARGREVGAQFPCVLMYFGPRPERFADVMSSDNFARVVRRWRLV